MCSRCRLHSIFHSAVWLFSGADTLKPIGQVNHPAIGVLVEVESSPHVVARSPFFVLTTFIRDFPYGSAGNLPRLSSALIVTGVPPRLARDDFSAFFRVLMYGGQRQAVSKPCWACKFLCNLGLHRPTYVNDVVLRYLAAGSPAGRSGRGLWRTSYV